MGMNTCLDVCGIGSHVYLESMATGRRGRDMKVAGYIYRRWGTSRYGNPKIHISAFKRLSHEWAIRIQVPKAPKVSAIPSFMRLVELGFKSAVTRSTEGSDVQ